VDRTSNGSGKVRLKSLSELRELDFGYHYEGYRGKGVLIPTLEEVLESFPGVSFSIDIKARDSSCVPSVIEIIRRSNAAGRTILSSFHRKIFRTIRSLAPDIPSAADRIGALTTYAANRTGSTSPAAFARYDIYMLPVHQRGLRFAERGYIEAVHRAGRRIVFWTVDDEEVMAKLLAMGADGIVTNRADRLEPLLGPPVGD
jgi:glycerophosphoryl diester phosphodiesterase